MTTKYKSPLRKARALISDPSKWTQGASARDINGIPVGSGDDDAVCWCASGAHIKTVGYGHILRSDSALQDAAQLLGAAGFVFFNDHPGRTHDQVMWMFDLAVAIDEVEKEGA